MTRMPKCILPNFNPSREYSKINFKNLPFSISWIRKKNPRMAVRDSSWRFVSQKSRWVDPKSEKMRFTKTKLEKYKEQRTGRTCLHLLNNRAENLVALYVYNRIYIFREQSSICEKAALTSELVPRTQAVSLVLWMTTWLRFRCHETNSREAPILFT